MSRHVVKFEYEDGKKLELPHIVVRQKVYWF
jgi:hypothetical protein